MFDWLKSNLFSDKKKQTVLLFGASKGGESVYEVIRHQYHILGFVDNNKSIQGKKLRGINIYAPTQLVNLNFDLIIIASDYHVEIKKQLINSLGINIDAIRVFGQTEELEQKTLPINCWQHISHLKNYLVLDTPYFFARYIFSFLSFIDSQFQNNLLKKIYWLDELESYKVKIFLESEKYESYQPHFVGEESQSFYLQVPEVSLYHFKSVEVMTSVNAVQLSESEVVLGRVPFYPVKNSQYDAGFIAAHGTFNALIKNYPKKSIKRGIAILGSNDGNYYHSLIEVLSKLQFINGLPQQYQGYPILISKRVIEIKALAEFIECLTISNKLIYLESCVDYRVEDLLFITPPNYFVCNLSGELQWSVDSNYIRESSLAFIRNSVLKRKASTNVNLKLDRLFLARKGVIRDYNQDEVISLLTHYGFQAVYLEDLNLFEQASLMFNAQYIIGPTGAAWTNLIFCQPRTKALCWMAEEIGDFSCFSDLASFSGVDLQYLRYAVSANNSRSSYYAGYRIEVGEIESWLSAKGLSEMKGH